MAESAKTGSEEFGDLLRQARQRLGMSRRDLAEATGLSYPYISQIETGYRMPSSPAVRSLADALGLRVEHLFGAIPPTTSRDSQVRAGAPKPPPAAPAAPMAPAASALAGTAHDAGAAPVTDAVTSARGGGWVANARYMPTQARSALRADARPSVDTPGSMPSTVSSAGAGVRVDRDRVVEQATELLTSLTHLERLGAVNEVQSRVVRSVVEDELRERG